MGGTTAEWPKQQDVLKWDACHAMTGHVCGSNRLTKNAHAHAGPVPHCLKSFLHVRKEGAQRIELGSRKPRTWAMWDAIRLASERSMALK